MAKLILLAQGSRDIPDLGVHLRAAGYDVESVGLSVMTELASTKEFDVILMATDGQIPDFLGALANLRALPHYPPVLLIGGSGQDPMLAIRALKCGCDGVISSPADLLHLDAWIEALIRRRKMSERYAVTGEALVRIGELEIDIHNRTVRTKVKRNDLTERELQLLLCLARKQGRVCSRQELLESVWDSSSPSLHGTLNTHINRIRIKIEEDLRRPKYLVGVYGLGYRLLGGEEDPHPGPSLAPAEEQLASPTS